MTFRDAACRCATWFAHPLAIVMLPLACFIWFVVGLGTDSLTLALSILAISTTQLVLVAQASTEQRMEAMVRELVRAVPEADEAVVDG